MSPALNHPLGTEKLSNPETGWKWPWIASDSQGPHTHDSPINETPLKEGAYPTALNCILKKNSLFTTPPNMTRQTGKQDRINNNQYQQQTEDTVSSCSQTGMTRKETGYQDRHTRWLIPFTSRSKGQVNL